jgi:transcriptional regulator with PAS, ATPase and Fis domain
MNDTEAKIESNDNGNAVRSAWQGKPRVIVAGMEPAVDWSLRSFRNEAEVHAINCALRQTGGNRKRAAKLLGISHRSLLYKIRQHNITPTVQHS